MKKLIKHCLGRAIYQSRLHKWLLKDKAVIVTFHRIDNNINTNEVVSCTEEQFAHYCDFFKKYFDVVSLSDLVNDLQENNSLSGKLAITFDDGYKDNYTIAAPILTERNLPACFFIVTNYIGTDYQTYWDIKSGFPSEWMSWDNIRALYKMGFDIGSHTHTHPNLGEIDATEARKELQISQDIIQKELSSTPTILATPFGKQHCLSIENKEEIKMIYEANFSSLSGFVSNNSDQYFIKRNNIHPNNTTPYSWGLQFILNHKR